MPCVVLGDGSEPDYPDIAIDVFHGAYVATRHLIELEHSWIGLLIDPLARRRNAVREQLRGVESAMRDSGLSEELCRCAHREFSIGTVADEHRRPTALICHSELESVAVAQGLWQMGLEIPRDISVVGFTEAASFKAAGGPLTSVTYDSRLVGLLAAQAITSYVQAWYESRGDTACQPYDSTAACRPSFDSVSHLPA